MSTLQCRPVNIDSMGYIHKYQLNWVDLSISTCEGRFVDINNRGRFTLTLSCQCVFVNIDSKGVDLLIPTHWC